jgi:LmbE family N-acetylglucosaminyl deacetylase
MRWIFLSPHLDDAVLSAGGLIREQTQAGIPVEIWTLMCGFPEEGVLSNFASALHMLWGFSTVEEVVQGRRTEDEQAATLLGARSLHFDFLDAIYRRDAKGEWLYPENISLDPQPSDSDLPASMAESISVRLLPDDVVVCPLGIGRHVDHVLVRAAGDLLGHALWYYADIPYLFNHPEHLAPATNGMSSVNHPVSDESLKAWTNAVQVYRSQLSTVFADPDEIPRLFREYCHQNGGITLWRSEKSGA